MDKEKKSGAKNTSKTPSWKKFIIILLFSILLFALASVILLFGYDKVYAEKIFPGVKIANYDAGGQTKEQIDDFISNYTTELSGKKINLSYEGVNLSPSLEELGVAFDTEKLLNDAYSVGRNDEIINNYWNKINAVFFSVKVSPSFTVDEEKLNEYINQNTGLNKDAKDAALKSENNELVVVLSEIGRRLDVDKFKADVNTNIIEDDISKQIKLNSIELKPEISEQEIVEIKPKIEEMVSEPLILQYGYKKYEVDTDQMTSWLVVKKDNQNKIMIEFADDMISEYIESIAKYIDKKAIDKKINAETNQVIEEGRDGTEIDRNVLIHDIKSILNNPSEEKLITILVKETERKERFIQPEDLPKSGGTPGLYAGRYIEVNLSEQKMYAFEGESLAGAYTVSTGKWSTPTPVGTRYIGSKIVRAYSQEYNLYMPWWNSLGGGYGIHELPEWAGGYKEGQSHLGTPVSHGCIRLGVGPAEFIYYWAPVGTPVYIHK